VLSPSLWWEREPQRVTCAERASQDGSLLKTPANPVSKESKSGRLGQGCRWVGVWRPRLGERGFASVRSMLPLQLPWTRGRLRRWEVCSHFSCLGQGGGAETVRKMLPPRSSVASVRNMLPPPLPWTRGGAETVRKMLPPRSSLYWPVGVCLFIHPLTPEFPLLLSGFKNPPCIKQDHKPRLNMPTACSSKYWPVWVCCHNPPVNSRLRATPRAQTRPHLVNTRRRWVGVWGTLSSLIIGIQKTNLV